MIVRDGTGFRAAFRMLFVKNWLVILVILGIERAHRARYHAAPG